MRSGQDAEIWLCKRCLYLEAKMLELLTHLREEAGQTMAEYAVVLGVITIAVVVTLGLLSSAIQNLLSQVIATL